MLVLASVGCTLGSGVLEQVGTTCVACQANEFLSAKWALVIGMKYASLAQNM